MRLMELFDQPREYKWTTQQPRDRFVATFMVGDVLYRFSAHWFPYENEETGDELSGYEIAFCASDGKKCRTDNTGTGNELAVYSTVVSLIREVVNMGRASRIAYDAADIKRKKIYPALIKKALPGWQLAEHDGDWFYYDKQRRHQ